MTKMDWQEGVFEYIEVRQIHEEVIKQLQWNHHILQTWGEQGRHHEMGDTQKYYQKHVVGASWRKEAKRRPQQKEKLTHENL